MLQIEVEPPYPPLGVCREAIVGGSNPGGDPKGDNPRDPPQPNCPETVTTILSDYSGGGRVGDPVHLTASRTRTGVRADVVLSRTGATIGVLSGTPRLAALLRCLEAGVAYTGAINRIENGAVYVTVSIT